MSRQSLRNVEFYTEGKLVKTVTDTETARAIEAYKKVYNTIDKFHITSRTIPAERDDFVQTAILAQSGDLQIICVKEYLPDVPEIIDGAQYSCGISNSKGGKFKNIGGGVPVLYYKLFHGRTK